ncbi:HAD family hydrolase [candidate division KSB1 bacterium]
MVKKLVLFDIDGTMISSGSGARRSLKKAMMKNTGISVKPTYDNTAGRTDRWIVRNFLQEAGKDNEYIENKIDDIFRDYIAVMKEEYNKDDDAVIFEGVRELLSALHNMNNTVYLGLLTGNIEEGARIKLSPFDVNKYFPFGAYGDDVFYRNELPAIADKKAKELYGIDFKGKDIVIIGDTEFDVECGKLYNTKTIAVVRRPEKEEEVKKSNPDYFCTGFQDIETIIKEILS